MACCICRQSSSGSTIPHMWKRKGGTTVRYICLFRFLSYYFGPKLCSRSMFCLHTAPYAGVFCWSTFAICFWSIVHTNVLLEYIWLKTEYYSRLFMLQHAPGVTGPGAKVRAKISQEFCLFICKKTTKQTNKTRKKRKENMVTHHAKTNKQKTPWEMIFHKEIRTFEHELQVGLSLRLNVWFNFGFSLQRLIESGCEWKFHVPTYKHGTLSWFVDVGKMIMRFEQNMLYQIRALF